jgi:xanthine dehydrogenase accessory factor
MTDWLATLAQRLESEPAVVRVVVAATRGSAPREAGACMLVGAAAVDGTIGGGNLEWKAIHIARDMLREPGAEAMRVDRFSLGATLGQCCGGAVELRFERHAQADREALARRLIDEPRPRAMPLWLFGAGHVGNALVRVLESLPFQVTWVDGREGVFPESLPGNVSVLRSDVPESEVPSAPAEAFYLVLTHSHDLDYEILRAILRRDDFSWLGLIGSDTKARRFRQRLAAQGMPPALIARVVCPIGIDGIDSKLPGAIAVSVAAQLQQVAEAQALRAAAKPSAQRTGGG